MGMSDEQLLGRAVDGDAEALSSLLEQHGEVVRRKLSGRIPKDYQSVLEVGDVMQVSYLEAFSGIRQRRPESPAIARKRGSLSRSRSATT